jgi:hypothetical protein
VVAMVIVVIIITIVIIIIILVVLIVVVDGWISDCASFYPRGGLVMRTATHPQPRDVVAQNPALFLRLGLKNFIKKIGRRCATQPTQGAPHLNPPPLSCTGLYSFCPLCNSRCVLKIWFAGPGPTPPPLVLGEWTGRARGQVPAPLPGFVF